MALVARHAQMIMSVLVVMGAMASSAEDDALGMKSGIMNPDVGLRTVERIGCGEFKVLIYGNSIALHGPLAKIGWTNNWGMAASAPEKDFAHLVVAGPEPGRMTTRVIQGVRGAVRQSGETVHTIRGTSCLKYGIMCRR